MNISEKFWSWVGRKTALSSWARAWLAGHDTSSTSAAANLSNAMLQVPWVYAAVTAKAAKLTQVGLELYAPNQPQPIESGPAYQLLLRPHPLLDRAAFIELLSLWLDLRGEFFVIALDKSGAVIPARRGPANIASLHILPPDQMTEVIDRNELVAWEYRSSGPKDFMSSHLLLPEEVIHCRLPNPFHPWRGLSPLTIARIATEADYTAAIFMRGLLANNADTGIIVTTDQLLSPEAQEQIKAALRERKRAAGTPDRPLLLHGGMKIEKPTIAAADLQFLENRKYLRQEILAVFRVPQDILGYTEDANRSVSEQQAANWVQNVIAPLARRIGSALSAITAPVEIWFDLDDLPEMQALRRARFDAAVKIFQCGVPWNDINKELDLGFPEYPWGNTGFLPYSIQPAASILAEPSPPAPPGPSTQSTITRPIILHHHHHHPIHTCAPADPGWEAKRRREARLTKTKLARFFFEQRARILSRLASQLKSIPASHAITKSAEIDWDALFDFVNERTALEGILKPRLIATFEAGARDLLAELGMASTNLKPEAAIAFFERRQNMITSITQDKFDQIKTSLQEGLANGESFELADRVRAEYNAFTDYQAERIADTETTMAMNNGRMEGMLETGVKKKAWKTAKLENVRATHLEAEQRSLAGIPIEEPFSNGLMFPGDPDGPPEEIINCRCFLIPVLD